MAGSILEGEHCFGLKFTSRGAHQLTRTPDERQLNAVEDETGR